MISWGFGVGWFGCERWLVDCKHGLYKLVRSKIRGAVLACIGLFCSFFRMLWADHNVRAEHYDRADPGHRTAVAVTVAAVDLVAALAAASSAAVAPNARRRGGAQAPAQRKLLGPLPPPPRPATAAANATTAAAVAACVILEGSARLVQHDDAQWRRPALRRTVQSKEENTVRN